METVISDTAKSTALPPTGCLARMAFAVVPAQIPGIPGFWSLCLSRPLIITRKHKNFFIAFSSLDPTKVLEFTACNHSRIVKLVNVRSLSTSFDFSRNCPNSFTPKIGFKGAVVCRLLFFECWFFLHCNGGVKILKIFVRKRERKKRKITDGGCSFIGDTVHGKVFPVFMDAFVLIHSSTLFLWCVCPFLAWVSVALELLRRRLVGVVGGLAWQFWTRFPGVQFSFTYLVRSGYGVLLLVCCFLVLLVWMGEFNFQASPPSLVLVAQDDGLTDVVLGEQVSKALCYWKYTGCQKLAQSNYNGNPTRGLLLCHLMVQKFMQRMLSQVLLRVQLLQGMDYDQKTIQFNPRCYKSKDPDKTKSTTAITLPGDVHYYSCSYYHFAN